jgi:hypothetical protein
VTQRRKPKNRREGKKMPDVKGLRMVAVSAYLDKEGHPWWTTCGGFFDGDHMSVTWRGYGMTLEGRFLLPLEELDEKTQVALEKIARRIIAEDRSPNRTYKGPLYGETKWVFHVTEEDIRKALDDPRPIDETEDERKYFERPKGFGLKRYHGKSLNVRI